MRQQSRHLPAFILLLLAERPLHGGAIQGELESSLPVLKADSGAVYRTLHQLEGEGEVTFTWDTSQPGPARKIYSLTPEGWARLTFWREDIGRRMQTLNYFMDKHDRLVRDAAFAKSAAPKGKLR